MTNAVFCTVASRAQATQLVDQLKMAGFASKDISVLMPNNDGEGSVTTDTSTKTPEGAAVGLGTGALLGGGLGWLAGIGALAIPGLGPLIAAGPIVAALTGAAVGGAMGGITGALIGMGIPEHQAQRYEQRVKEGRALVSVHTYNDTEFERARTVLELAGGEDISSSEKSTAGA